MLATITGGKCKENPMDILDDELSGIAQEPKTPKKIVSIRCGSSVLWLDSDLDLLPQKEGTRRRHREVIKTGHDKQVRPRHQSRKYDDES